MWNCEINIFIESRIILDARIDFCCMFYKMHKIFSKIIFLKNYDQKYMLNCIKVPMNNKYWSWFKDDVLKTSFDRLILNLIIFDSKSEMGREFSFETPNWRFILLFIYLVFCITSIDYNTYIDTFKTNFKPSAKKTLLL